MIEQCSRENQYPQIGQVGSVRVFWAVFQQKIFFGFILAKKSIYRPVLTQIGPNRQYGAFRRKWKSRYWKCRSTLFSSIVNVHACKQNISQNQIDRSNFLVTDVHTYIPTTDNNSNGFDMRPWRDEKDNQCWRDNQ